MPKTPSMGIDQNDEKKFIDKYWGNLSQFLVYIPEAYNCEVNPDYLRLLEGYLLGTVKRENISPSLLQEIENIVVNIDCPCLLTGKERAIVEAYLGNEPCQKPSAKLNCNEAVCCNELVLCYEDTVCEEEGEENVS